MMLQQRRKLFLLVFLVSCLCLVIFETSLFSSSLGEHNNVPSLESNVGPINQRVRARSAGQTPSSQASPLATLSASSVETTTYELGGSDDRHNGNKYHYSVSSPPPSSSHAYAPIQPNTRPKLDGQSMSAAHSNEQQQQQQVIVGNQCQYDYPSLFDLQFNNIHWQKFVSKSKSDSTSNPEAKSSPDTSQSHSHSSNSSSSQTTSEATYYLYNAYYDDRWRAGPASVRILAMIDRIHPPPTNCLLWSSKLRLPEEASNKQAPLVTRAQFVYAWYPKWGNYKDGILQPWIVTCPLPHAYATLVPDSVSLVEVPPEVAVDSSDLGTLLEDVADLEEDNARARRRRDVAADGQQASIAMPPAFSSSSLSPNVASSGSHQSSSSQQPITTNQYKPQYDCQQTLPISNNLPVYNQRPKEKKKFAVCVKGLDFPHEDVSVRLVEWIELLNLLGAEKIFLYDLDVHENISKVLHYYQERGIVELSPLTLPGDQPNLPEYQHLYLKNRLTAKRQNELIPYNDCLYRNLNSYQYLALLDIDEIIMPLEHRNWFDLMEEVERLSLAEQNYSRASYNVRNVYFFDDLAGPLGTTSTSSSSSTSQQSVGSSSAESNQQQAPFESGIPSYLHMMQHVYRSRNYTEPGQYVKCFHNTDRVVSLHNHFPMNCFGQCTTYSIPTKLAHLQHYRKDCVGPLRQSCKNNFRAFTMRDTTIWKYKQQMIRRTTRVLNHLNRNLNLPPVTMMMTPASSLSSSKHQVPSPSDAS